MSAIRYFPLTIIAIMALAAVKIFIVNQLRRQPRPMMAETCAFVP